ncbi:hypothetical protein [Salinimicrobium sp. GXAS 041]|uniref:hypothetical protein n=1 Tax=Salinimicrobium sp. GXAS 041 TaxID=3400806 RepID=UPI003C70A135
MSFGSAIGAIVSLKNNRRTRTAKTDKYLATTGGKIKGVKSHRKPSKEELRELSAKIAAENKKRQQKILLITTAILVIFTSVFFYFF